QSGEFEVVPRCQDGLEAWQKIELLKPPLAVLDLALPRLFAGEILRRCRSAALPTRCVIVAPRSDRKAVVEALRSGAQAYVLKTDPGIYLIDALRQVRDGGVYVSPTLPIQSLFIPKTRQEAHADPFELLSSREHEVFTLLVAGYRAKEIAATLDLSPKTVDTYRSNLMRKLDIRDVASLVKFAIERNLTELQ
ncbi:MAG: response regulator transcription factor, partial [Acidobacteria bacterium]|nr:response regulator transcription factor [Acidobacteriota bacterium]